MLHLRTTCFTLLELIVVMLLLAIATALVAPHLSGFFHGRRLDGEARRFWALTRFGRDEAIRQAVPMRVWFDPDVGHYGLEVVPGYGVAALSRYYQLPVHIEVTAPAAAVTGSKLALTWWPDGSLDRSSASTIVLVDRRRPDDCWYVTRLEPLAIYTLQRQAPR